MRHFLFWKILKGILVYITYRQVFDTLLYLYLDRARAMYI
jgi:hypothetical protein